jgi:hypothetical protein
MGRRGDLGGFARKRIESASFISHTQGDTR